jgi:endonuclease V-like protein UPF0215 family
MSGKKLSNVIGLDDAPFPAGYQGAVPIVGTVFAQTRLTGVLMGHITKDGSDAAENIIELIQSSKFGPNVQLLLLQGVALGGFNVVDVFAVHQALQIPVLIVARRQPDFPAVRSALLQHVPYGAEKWGIIEQLGPMEAVENSFIQRVGLDLAQATAALKALTIEGNIPEPLRTAHLIAGAIGTGQSRGRT